VTGECADCGRKRAFGLQAKPLVSNPGDSLEREADWTAERVMRMPDRVPGTADVRAGASVKGLPVAQDGLAELLRSPALATRSDAIAGVSGHAPAALERLRGQRGAPLEAKARAFMEPRFRHDFSHVRVHTGTLASAAARAVDARAFTSGRDIVFGDGEYRPQAQDGRRLIAHELAHVVQQGAAPTAGSILRTACPGECLECPPDGVVREGCECLGDEKPRAIVSVPIPIRIVRLHGAGSEGAIRRGIRQANKTWRSAGIELRAEIHSIDRADTEKILGTDDRGRLRDNVQIEPASLALNADSTRALLGLTTESGAEKLSIPAGTTPHNVVVYYVPEFNRCSEETEAVGCAFRGSLGGRYFVLIERRHQDVALAHELGHIWGNEHVENKRNVMHSPAERTGLTAGQIVMARRTLGLGSLRCLAGGQSDTDRERIVEEQQKGQLLLLLIKGQWAGLVTVNGTPRDSTIKFETTAGNRIHGVYWYETLAGDRAGGVLDGVVTAGQLVYDWKQTTGEESTGKGSFALSSILPPFRLSGRWGVGESRANGGEWTVTSEPPAGHEP